MSKNYLKEATETTKTVTSLLKKSASFAQYEKHRAQISLQMKSLQDQIQELERQRRQIADKQASSEEAFSWLCEHGAWGCYVPWFKKQLQDGRRPKWIPTVQLYARLKNGHLVRVKAIWFELPLTVDKKKVKISGVEDVPGPVLACEHDDGKSTRHRDKFSHSDPRYIASLIHRDWAFIPGIDGSNMDSILFDHLDRSLVSTQYGAFPKELIALISGYLKFQDIHGNDILPFASPCREYYLGTKSQRAKRAEKDGAVQRASAIDYVRQHPGCLYKEILWNVPILFPVDDLEFSLKDSSKLVWRNDRVFINKKKKKGTQARDVQSENTKRVKLS